MQLQPVPSAIRFECKFVAPDCHSRSGEKPPVVQGDGCGETTAKRRIKFAGEHTARVTPVPIPNTEVKPRWADGTARVTVWEIR